MMNGMDELVFEVVQEADGGYCAECLTQSIYTQADSWDELRRNVVEAVNAFFFSTGRRRQAFVCTSCAMRFFPSVKIPRDVSGQQLVDAPCRDWQYIRVHQVGSHVILEI